MSNCILQGSGTGSGCGAPRGYRIRSGSPIRGDLWPTPGARELDVSDRCLAVTLAAKSTTSAGGVIEVVHVASGEVIFRKPAPPRLPAEGGFPQ